MYGRLPALLVLASLPLSSILAATGCREATEVVVVVDGDATVRDRAAFLALRVTDGEGEVVADRIDAIGEGTDEVRFPQAIPLAPRGGDASRRWALTVEALTATDCVLATAEESGGYEQGRSERLALTLTVPDPDPCPAGAECEGAGDCDDGLDCTDDECADGFCVHTASGGCAIDGACVAAGAEMAGDSCRVCDPERATGEWSLAPGCDVAEVGPIAVGEGAGDQFGHAVAVSGDRVVVGAPEADPDGLEDAGAAYVFARRASGEWELEARLVAREAAAGDQQGRSVAIDGDYLVVGAPFADPPEGTNAGAAYVFRRGATGWAQIQRLAGTELGGYDRFGYSVAIDGELVAVGAPYDDPPGEAGAVYLFERVAEDRFAEVTPRLLSPTPESEGYFGYSVDVSGPRIVVGEPRATRGTEPVAGAGHLFERHEGGEVVHLTELAAMDPQGDAWLGQRVAIDGPTAILGAPLDDRRASDAGAVLVYPSDGSAGEESASLTPAASASGDQMGRGVDISLPYVAAGATFGDPPAGSAAGVVYLFKLSEGSWSPFATVVARDGAPDAKLGRGVAIDGRWLVAGAPGASPGGTIHLFELRL